MDWTGSGLRLVPWSCENGNEKYYDLKYDKICSCGNLPTFRWKVLPTSSGYKYNPRKQLALPACYRVLFFHYKYRCETSVNLYPTTRRHIPDASNLHSYSREDPIST
jgi:hypothetical protein